MKINAGLSVDGFTITLLGDSDHPGQFDLIISKAGQTSVTQKLFSNELQLLQDLLKGLLVITGDAN